MTDKIESKGKTVDDAVNEALLQMGVRRDEVKVEVLEEGKSGLFGIIGGKQARVLVSRKPARGGSGRRDYRQKDKEAVTHQLSDGGGGGNRRGGQEGRSQEGRDQEGRSQGSRRRRGGRGRGRGGRRDESRGAEASQDSGRTQDRNQSQDNKSQDNKSQDNNRDQDRNRNRDQDRRAEGGERNERGSSRRRGRSRRNNQEQAAGNGNERGNERRDDRQDDRRPRREAQDRNDVLNDAGNESRTDQEQSRGGRRSSRSRSRRSRRSEPEQREQTTVAASGMTEGMADGNQVDARQEESRNQRPSGDDGRREGGRSRRSGQGGRGAAARVDHDSASVDETRTEKSMSPEEIIVSGIPATRYAQPTRDIADEQIDETLQELTSGMLIRAGFPVRCEVKDGEYRQIRIVTDDSSAGMLIGRHGAAVDSIEHLVDRMAGIATGDRVKMNLDINNYRRRRQDTLHDRVADAIEQVQQSGKSFHMESMNPRERRMVHLQVEPVEGVRTYTIGGGATKHVVIALEDGVSPEAPEAAQADGATDSGDEQSTAATHFEEFDDGPQPETNELVVDDDDYPSFR